MIRFFWNEEWKELVFEEGALRKRYAISNYGRIVSYVDEISSGDLIKGGVLQGYTTLPMRPYGKSKTFYVHKLVAELFHEKENDNQVYVIHLDYNKKNNFYKNLRWADKNEMLAHQKDNPLVIESREKQRGRTMVKGQKLTATQVLRLKMKINDPNRKTRLKMLAKQFGISEMQLYRIKSGENWGHITVDSELKSQ